MKKVLSGITALLSAFLAFFLYLSIGTISSLLSWFFWSLAVIGLDKEKRFLLKELSDAEDDECYADNSSVGLSMDQEMRLGARLEDLNRRIDRSQIPVWRQTPRKTSQKCLLSFP